MRTRVFAEGDTERLKTTRDGKDDIRDQESPRVARRHDKTTSEMCFGPGMEFLAPHVLQANVCVCGSLAAVGRPSFATVLRCYQPCLPTIMTSGASAVEDDASDMYRRYICPAHRSRNRERARCVLQRQVHARMGQANLRAIQRYLFVTLCPVTMTCITPQVR